MISKESGVPHGTELTASEIRLRDGAIAPLFRRYAIPGVIGLLFLGLQTIIDGVVLGNFVGANALASVSLVLPSYSFMAALAIITGVGCQTLVSIRLGEQNRQGANDAMFSAFIFLTIFSVIVSMSVVMLAPQIATLLGANSVLMAGAVGYIQGLFPFFPIIAIMFWSDYIIKAIGKPVYAMSVMSGTVVLNILLDLLFVVVWEMGTFGAGLATGLAFTVGAAFYIPIVFGSKNVVSVFKGRFRGSLVWQMFYNGSSEGISELSSGISTLLFNLALMRYLGESGVAAFTAINYLFFIGITVFLGISDGIIPIISYNYGAGLWDRIKKVLWMAVRTNFLIGLSLFLLLTFFGQQFISLFFRAEDSAVLDIAAHGTSIYAFAFLINGGNILTASYFTAMANAKISIIVSLLRGLIFVAAGIYILPLVFGIEGIWYAVPLSETLTIIVSVILLRRSLRHRAKVSI